MRCGSLLESHVPAAQEDSSSGLETRAQPDSKPPLADDVAQRLLYWGALRAFFRPAFLRSGTRASRVRKPAFFSAGRFSSSSTPFSERATPRRTAPAWPEGPPPCTRTSTSYEPSSSSTLKGSLTICWCTLFGKYSSRVRLLIF